MKDFPFSLNHFGLSQFSQTPRKKCSILSTFYLLTRNSMLMLLDKAGLILHYGIPFEVSI